MVSRRAAVLYKSRQPLLNKSPNIKVRVVPSTPTATGRYTSVLPV